MRLRLRRLVRLMRVLVWLGMALLVCLPTLAWIDPGLMPGAGAGGTRTGLPTGQRLIGWALTLPPFLVLAWGLAQLATFCRDIEGPRRFTTAAAAALHRFGLALVAAGLALPASRLLVAMALDGGAVDLRPLAGTAVLLGLALGLLFGLVFVVFAALLREATELADENEAFV